MKFILNNFYLNPYYQSGLEFPSTAVVALSGRWPDYGVYKVTSLPLKTLMASNLYFSSVEISLTEINLNFPESNNISLKISSEIGFEKGSRILLIDNNSIGFPFDTTPCEIESDFEITIPCTLKKYNQFLFYIEI